MLGWGERDPSPRAPASSEERRAEVGLREMMGGEEKEVFGEIENEPFSLMSGIGG